MEYKFLGIIHRQLIMEDMEVLHLLTCNHRLLEE